MPDLTKHYKSTNVFSFYPGESGGPRRVLSRGVILSDLLLKGISLPALLYK